MNKIVAASLCLAFAPLAYAASPEQVSLGQQLFTQEFTSTPLGIGGDGLGPVFNESSCVACHNVGGVGGAGDASKNARSLALYDASLLRRGTSEELNAAVAKFSPGFVSTAGSIQTSFSLHRRGGSAPFQSLREKSMSHVNSDWNDDRKVSCDTVHLERAAKKLTNPEGDLKITVHVFARNTTSLFGTWAIDQVPDSAILAQAKIQQRDHEVSGRPGTLEDGRIGKFGWRANFATLVDFNENACAAELGLQSRRVTQPTDLMNRTYRNTTFDLGDEAIEAMNAFVTSLPRPERAISNDSESRRQVEVGERRFTMVGCAKCHVPNLGTLQGLYSDLLLHDNGPQSADYATAPPFRKAFVVDQRVTEATANLSGIYYGPLTTLVVMRNDTVDQANDGRGFPYARRPLLSPKEVTTPFGPKLNVPLTSDKTSTRIARVVGTRESVEVQQVSIAEVEPTLVNQEWKTPPLWGVRDSAPYMHDGRAATILEAIAMHDGEARRTRNRFFALSYDDQQAVLAFLDSFVAPTQGVIPAPPKFVRRAFVAW